jgi:hypothetical protein
VSSIDLKMPCEVCHLPAAKSAATQHLGSDGLNTLSNKLDVVQEGESGASRSPVDEFGLTLSPGDHRWLGHYRLRGEPAPATARPPPAE